MIELYFKYKFSTFSGNPKIDLGKIPECKVKKYNVDKDNVLLVVICDDKDISEKLKHYYGIRYELFPYKEKII
jgi:hypothetical protein